MSLSKREIVLIGILLLAGIVYAFYTYLYSPVKTQTDALRTENGQLQTILQEADKTKKSNINPADNLKKLQTQYKDLLVKVPEDPYVPEMMVYLADSAKDSKVELNSLNYTYDDKQSQSPATGDGEAVSPDAAKANNSGKYRSSKLDVEAQGTYYDLLTFILKVEKAPRLFVLTSAKFSANRRKPPDQANDISPTTASTSGNPADATGGTPNPEPVQVLAGSAAYDGNNITLHLNFESYYDQMTTDGMKGVDQEVVPTAQGKNPFM